MRPINQATLKHFESIKDTQDLLKAVFNEYGSRAAIGTSGQLTGVVMIDMAAASGIIPRVFTIDTHRLFNETYALLEELEKKYKIHIERFTPNADTLKKMVAQHGKHLFFDSKEKQEYCCYVRKVVPNNEALKTVDVWFTGLRADQSENREDTQKFEIITHPQDKHPILKIAPLVDWTEDQLRKYAKKNKVPIHPLLDWNQDGWRYESLGCRICTTPIGPHEPRRAGRWRWFKSDDDKKECGIHLPGSEE